MVATRMEYQMNMLEIREEHLHLLDQIRAIVIPWRKLTIGIDGADGVGKSTLARWLSWQLEMPTLETDMFWEKGEQGPSIRYDDLLSLIERRHALKRPIIVEGIFLLETLEHIHVPLNVLIYVVNRDFDGSDSLHLSLENYRERYKPQKAAQFIFEIGNKNSE